MKTKNYLILLLFTFCLTTGAYSQKTIWGGNGEVYLSSAQISPGSSVNIKYKVTESLGTGTADFRCEITTPDGLIFDAKKTSTKWVNGSAVANFSCPYDFSGDDNVKFTTKTTGNYLVQCYWYINGNGVNGKVAAGTAVLVVVNQ